jgi:hypothetical protein
MMIEMKSDNVSDSNIDESVSLPSQMVFYIFLLLDIPSVACSLLLFYCFIYFRELRQHQYSNQIMIYLLVGSFLVTAVDIPLILPYLQNNYFIESMKYPNSFCVFWVMYDYGMYSINLWLMSLACLERYLFIFYKELIMKNRTRRCLMYYVPVTIIILFVIFWYLYLVALYPCDKSQFDFTQTVCGFPCYKVVGSVTILNTDWTVADLLPVFLTIFFILILIFHVIYQRHKIGKHLIQPKTWKRTRKMFLQLVPIALIFLIFNMPLIIVGLLAISNPWYNTIPYFYVNSLSYCLSLFMPFAILSKQTIIQKRISNIIRLTRFNQIAPIPLTRFPLRLMNTQTVRNVGTASVKTVGM